MSDESKKLQHQKRKLARLTFAQTSFERVLFTCAYIKKHVSSDDDPLYHSLITAVCVTYSKPFTDNAGIGKLSDTLLRSANADHKATHEMLLNSRNFFYAHTDATHTARDPASHEEIYTQQAFLSVAYLKEDGKMVPEIRVGISEVKLRLSNLPRITNLSTHLLAEIRIEIEKSLKALLDGTTISAGIYPLDWTKE